MFATTCSFCQHENQPGARFCAECGSPLHLKVCQACGKVSDVQALKCESCGAAFPEIDMVAPVSRPPAATSSANEAQLTPPPEQKHNPWPLIAVAAVAGGLPFLWIFRNDLPMPKTWQSRAELQQELRTVPQSAAPVATPLRGPVAPAPQAPAAAEPGSISTPTAPTEASSDTPPAARTKHSPARAERPKANSRPCTDAVAALGLCNPSAAEKK